MVLSKMSPKTGPKKKSRKRGPIFPGVGRARNNYEKLKENDVLGGKLAVYGKLLRIWCSKSSVL